MLVISRKLGERIVVPQCGLAVTIIAVKGKAVRLGISAPETLAVQRRENWQRLDENDPDQQPAKDRTETQRGADFHA